jgi:hypothetical protein
MSRDWVKTGKSRWALTDKDLKALPVPVVIEALWALFAAVGMAGLVFLSDFRLIVELLFINALWILIWEFYRVSIRRCFAAIWQRDGLRLRAWEFDQ